MKIKKRPGLIAILMAALVFILLVNLTFFLLKRIEQKNKPMTDGTLNGARYIEEEPAPKTDNRIKLPGATPINPLPGDYQDDDHLWRMVNKSHSFNDKHYRPKQLTIIEASRTDKSNDERSVRTDIVPFVNKLFQAASKQGFELIIGSGFRGYDLQNLYYTNYVKNYGQAAADTFSAKPGYSEHQTGLTMDLTTADRRCYLEKCFGDTEAGKWLASHAHEYGFILRYPKDKAGKTDFIYEPWHFRYVGKDLASGLFKSGLTLDEAWPILIDSISQSSNK